MLAAIAQSLPIALGLMLAAVPMVIVSVILVIRRPPAVSGAFIGGWLIGLGAVGGIVIAAADLIDLAGQPSWWAGYLKLALGIALVVLGVRKWLGRPGPGEEPKVPKWMASLDTATPARGFTLGLLLAAANPKNIAFLAAGATTIAYATPRVHEQVVALACFVVVASLGILAPAVLNRLLGDRAEAILATADRWMTRNTDAIMSIVLVVIGLIVIGNGAATF